ncbi:uncharacterized protein LOC129586714 [Paramacrobiotus metropolitanus]|uniref:uncharacterized protein LOC129586714 n=1 Tax=Paramacrobiotus metropolitanus TaxID=2943436 RepID=UPI002445BF67|nr:uncharacterized protein LOC129586714 [Paramacrobiotus metropolitanus]
METIGFIISISVLLTSKLTRPETTNTTAEADYVILVSQNTTSTVLQSSSLQCYQCSGTTVECQIGGDPAALVRSCQGTNPRCTSSYSAGHLTLRACYDMKEGDDLGCKTTLDSTVCICDTDSCNSPQAYGPTYGPIDPAEARALITGLREAPVPGNLTSGKAVNGTTNDSPSHNLPNHTKTFGIAWTCFLFWLSFVNCNFLQRTTR